MSVGKVADYYKPVDGKTMCQMLMDGASHMWSGDSNTWAKPPAHNNYLGGSADGWLAKTKPDDGRDTPSFWGVTMFGPQTSTGGCCFDDYKGGKKAWGKPYKMEYCGLPPALAPICTPVTTVAGSFSADKDFWATACKDIPMTATYIKVVMGGTVDYYRPPTGKTFCEMLTASNAHKWSKDAKTWVSPSYDETSQGFGGSASNASLTGDGRKQVTFWGSDVKTNTGGCCYSSLIDKKPGFGRAFTMSYCEIPTPPATSELVSLLHSNEAAIQQLEDTMNTIHTRLEDAEGIDVQAAGNVSLAKNGMYKLAIKAKDENDQLATITMRTSLFGSDLDQAETQLVGARKQVSMATKSARATRKVADMTASPQGLQAQDNLNAKIWALLDPGNKNSLDATEKRVRNMEKATNKFRKQLRGQIREVLVTKMRRSTNKLRKVIHRLGTAGNKVSSSVLGSTDSSESLGADLGLNEE